MERISTQELRDDDPDIALLRVLRDDGGADPTTDPLLASEILLRGYREMRRLRLLDARMISLQRQGRIGFYAGARGQEAVPVAAALALHEEDWVFPALREQGVMLARGFPLRLFIAQVLGNSGDVLKGRQMPSHQAGRAVHQVSWSSCVGPQLPQAIGAAWAMRQRGADAIAIAFCGDGATSQADFHAAMNFAGVWRVPCVIVCQNNHWSISVPTGRQTASRTLAVKARAYGILGVRVDGNDFLASYVVMRDAFDRARAGGGPTFVEAVTYRMGAHSPLGPLGPLGTSDDPAMYRSASEVEAWAGKDPLDRLRKHLLQMGLLTDAADAALDEEISAEIRVAVTEAESLPAVERASLFGDVYAELPWHLREQLQVLKVGR
jgi:pyruvate dehydrogenase E1 component alpha subunit/2-oxoisovalerate dehydrogenase E1 component alpha subunit